MNPVLKKRVVSSTVGVGLGTLAVVGASPFLPWQPSAFVVSSFTIGGIALVLVGCAIWVADRISRKLRARDFLWERTKKGDLPFVFEMEQEYFGDDISSLELIRAWWDKNNEIFYTLTDVKSNGRKKTAKVVGYHCIVPLTAKAAERVKCGELRGSNISVSDITSAKGNCAAIYIGSVCAIGLRARGHAVSGLHDRIANHWASRTSHAYARPVTSAGLKLVQRFEFAPVGPKQGKGALYYRKLVPAA